MGHKKKESIIHVITALNQGGAENLLVSIANKLQEFYEVHIIVLKNNLDIIGLFKSSIIILFIGLG